MRTERAVGAFVITALIGLLVTATGAARHAAQENIWLTEQMRTDLGIIESLREANDALLVRLDAPPQTVTVEKVVRVMEPCRVTPVFARDSRFSGR